jgi:L-asparaginase II
MPSTLLATVTRGGLVESSHDGDIAVADASGRVLRASAGLDPSRKVYFRSSAKPIQALSLVESGAADAFGLCDREIALACASHSGEPEHVAAVAGLLARAGISARRLRCGVHPPVNAEAAAALIRAGEKPTCLCHNCSGKHTGMLLVCAHRGWPLATYLDLDHPLQQEIRHNVAECCGVGVREIHTGKDGCNLPAHAVTLPAMATAYGRLASPAFWVDRGNPRRAEAVRRITAAMMAHPFMVSGTGRSDNLLMTAGKGRIFSKGGAEAVWCAGIPGKGVGIAFKFADGNARADTVVMTAVLRQTRLLGNAALRRFTGGGTKPVTSGDGEVVGRIAPAFRLRRAAKRPAGRR